MPSYSFLGRAGTLLWAFQLFLIFKKEIFKEISSIFKLTFAIKAAPIL